MPAHPARPTTAGGSTTHRVGSPPPAATATAESGRISGAIGGAPRWVSGLLAGVQAALLSVLVVVTPALAAYVATSADPANAEIGWPRSVAVGAVLWLMGHGGVVEVDGATISLVPLGITALALFTAHASARRSAQPVRSAWLAGIGGYLAVVVVVLLAVSDAGPLGAGTGSVIRTLLGAVLIAAVGLGSGVVRGGRWREVTRPVWSAVPPLVRAGVRAGVMVTALLVTIAAALAGTWAISGRAAAGDVIEGLGLDTFSGLLLAVAQLAIAPNLVLWAVAWVAGPGFAIGAGTVFAPAEVVSGPLPALPLFGALPSEGAAGGPLRWVPVLVVLAGALAGWWLHRQVPPRTWSQPFLVAGCTALAAGVVTGGLVALAGGSAGPGRLAVVGAAGVTVGSVVAGLTLVGALLVTVPMDPVVRTAVRQRLGRKREPGVADLDGADDGVVNRSEGS